MYKKHLFLTALIFSLLIQTSTNITKAQNLNQELIVAVKDNNIEKIKQLTEKGADVNAKDENKATVLMWAAYKADFEVFKFLVDNNADYKMKGVIYTDTTKAYYYGNLLGIVAGENKTKILTFLLEKCKINTEDKEYNPESQKEDGWTALEWATDKGNDKIIEILIENGAKMTWAYFDSEVVKYYRAGNSKKAIEYCKKARKQAEIEFGKQHKNYATSCNNLAFLYDNIGKYLKAEPLHIEAKNIRESILGKEHPDYAQSCNNLAFLYGNMGKYLKAEPLYIEAKNIREKVLGKEHPYYAQSCNNLAILYNSMGNYLKAEPLYIEAKNIRENVLGEEHPDFAGSCNSLAGLYISMGKYLKAEPLYIEAKRIFEIVLGSEHPYYATSCNSLAFLYDKMGYYQKAEPLYIEAKNIRENILGKEHPDYAESCSVLALLYDKMGNYQKAELLHIEAKNIRENVLGKEHPHYATSCNNLALLYDNMSNYEKAEPLYIEAKNIIEKVLGKEHPNYAGSSNNLALLYKSIGNYQKAEPLYIEAKNIKEKVLGKEHPDYAISCNGLAGLYESIGNYLKAKLLYIEAKNIRENVLGKEHPDYAESCNNLALLYNKMGNYLKAEPLFIEASAIMDLLSNESAKFMSEKEREKYLIANINYNFEIYHSFFLKRRKNNKKLAGIVYNNALNIKGQLLRSVTTVRKLILQSGDTVLINTFNKMNNIGKILVNQYELPVTKRRKDIKHLEEKVNILEKELVRKSQTFAKVSNFDKVNWQSIKKTLKKDETAIEFIHFQYHNNMEWTDSTLYYALVLRKKYKYPKAVFLFEQEQLDKIMKRQPGTNEYNYIKELYDSKSKKAGSLYKLAWQPLEQHLKNTKNIYISPTGMLNKISFDALPYDTAKILSDKYKIIYTTSTAQLVNKAGLVQKNINNSVLFGGINYEIKPEEMGKLAEEFNKNDSLEYLSITDFPVNLRSKNIDKLTRNITWSYLPGSLEETKEIQDVLRKKSVKVKFYTGKQGSEEQFKALENDAPSILHVSTHGFYFGDDEKSNEYRDMIGQDVKFTHSDNPLLRSGFILAGGNTAFQGGKIPEGIEDGVLTALEMSRLNFFKTKLVVLSACQTGLGDVKGSEGVYGLQRAFKMAGVDYLLFSLWEVPDEATKELMTKFYEFWFSGLEIRDAFKKAQDHLKDKYKDIPGSAFAWAAFILMK